jgi:hypothetical protein
MLLLFLWLQAVEVVVLGVGSGWKRSSVHASPLGDAARSLAAVSSCSSTSLAVTAGSFLMRMLSHVVLEERICQ